VMALTAAAGTIREADTTRALAIAQLALATVTTIQPGTYATPTIAQLSGCVWKEIGHCHRFQSAYEAAFRAFDTAQHCFAREGALSHDEICAKFARVGALIFTRRYTDALSAIEQAEEAFRAFGDERRLTMTRLNRALVNQYQGAFDISIAQYEQLLAEIRNTDDIYTLACVYQNLGELYAELGRSSEAIVPLQEARALWLKLALPGLVSKVDWALARALLADGYFSDAAAILRRLRNEFLARQMPEDAGEVGLDIVETLVATNQLAQARALTEEVIDEFRAANLNEQAITAVGYLRDLLSTTQQARQAVKHVRSYIEKLKTEPARLFLPFDS